MANKTTSSIKAVQTMFIVVKGLQELNGAGVSKLSNHLGMPKSTVHKHLNTLNELGYLDKQDKVYKLSLKFTKIGQHARRENPIYLASKKGINELADASGELAGLLIEHDGQGHDLYTARGKNARTDMLDRNIPSLLHCSAPGKAILAQTSQRQIDMYIEDYGLPELTTNTITDHEALLNEVGLIRERGIAFGREEHSQDIRTVATTLEFESSDDIGAIYVAGSTNQLSGKRFEEDLPGMIASVSKKIRHQL